MSTPDEPLPASRLRTMQIIAAAILMGVVTFLFVALYIVLVQNQGRPLQPAAGVPVVTLLAAVLFSVNAALSTLLPRLMTEKGLKRIAAGTWAPANANPAAFANEALKVIAVMQSSMLVALALLEAAAFLAVFGYLLEGEWLGLVLVALSVALMLARFPRESYVRGRLQRHLDRLTELRQGLSQTAT